MGQAPTVHRRSARLYSHLPSRRPLQLLLLVVLMKAIHHSAPQRFLRRRHRRRQRSAHPHLAPATIAETSVGQAPSSYYSLYSPLVRTHFPSHRLVGAWLLLVVLVLVLVLVRVLVLQSPVMMAILLVLELVLVPLQSLVVVIALALSIPLLVLLLLLRRRRRLRRRLHLHLRMPVFLAVALALAPAPALVKPLFVLLHHRWSKLHGCLWTVPAQHAVPVGTDSAVSVLAPETW